MYCATKSLTVKEHFSSFFFFNAFEVTVLERGTPLPIFVSYLFSYGFVVSLKLLNLLSTVTLVRQLRFFSLTLFC